MKHVEMSFYTIAHPQVWNESDHFYITCMKVKYESVPFFISI